MKRMLAMLHARNTEFFRERSTLVWNLLFPFLLLIGFYYIFGQLQPLFKVGVLSQQDAYLTRPVFMSLKHVQFIPYDSSDNAIRRLTRHQVDLVIDIDRYEYWVNEESSQGYIAERLLIASDPDMQRNLVRGTAIRYVDWVLPGIMGMNIMFASLFGVGYAIVRYRKNGVLKRLHATPLTSFEFVTAQLLSRILMIVFIVLVLFFGSRWLFGTMMLGSYLLLLFTVVLGAGTLVSLGLLVAARLRSEEFTGGLLSMTTWPMMGLSEVWFPLEGSPHFVHQISNLLPLTHLVKAIRAIMIDGADLITISDHLLILAAMLGLFLSIGAISFNWNADGR
jgi:ABC-2 type transport system permease protein